MEDIEVLTFGGRTLSTGNRVEGVFQKQQSKSLREVVGSKVQRKLSFS